MERLKNNFSLPIVILANGELPAHKKPISIIKNAGTIICTDGAINNAIALGRSPQVVIGDMDSISSNPIPDGVKYIKFTDQNSTDLEKTLDWCLSNDISAVTLLGLTGKREDHTISNFAIMADYVDKLNLLSVTDYHEIQAISKFQEFNCIPKSTVSIITISGKPIVSTEGLQYPLKNEPFQNSGKGISNISKEEKFNLKVYGGVVLVFISHSD